MNCYMRIVLVMNKLKGHVFWYAIFYILYSWNFAAVNLSFL